LNIPILISSFQLADGDVLPGSKLIFPLFFGSVLSGAVSFWRRVGLTWVWIAVGALLVGTLPEVFRHSTYGYVNVPASAYLVLGTLWAIVGLTRRSAQHTAVGGILLALGAWTRVEGVLFAVAVTAAIAISAIWLRRDLISVFWLVLPITVIGGIWLMFYGLYGHGGSQTGNAMAAALAGWQSGDFHLHSLRLLFGYFRREVFDTETWGLLFPLAGILIAIRIRRLADRGVPEALPLALATFAFGTVTAGLFYVGSYNAGSLVGWLTRGFPRAFFPAAILLAILAVLVGGAPERPRIGDRPRPGA
jgi:hypothetical protein